MRAILFCLLLLSTSLFAQNEDALVARYMFSGNAEDESVHANHGNVDGPELTTDRFGNPDSAYEFDGEDDKITALDIEALRLSEEFTLVVWVMPYSVKDHSILRKNSSLTTFSSWPGYGLSLTGTNDYSFKLGTENSPSYIGTQLNGLVNSYEVNTWTRIIARKQDGDLTLITNKYTPGNGNGFSTYFGSADGNILHDTGPLVIGTRTSQASNSFEGKIDDIEIYDRFLTLEEVTGLDFSDDPVGIAESNPQLFVYPNPVRDLLHVELGEALSGAELVRLKSIDGKVQQSFQPRTTLFQLDMSSLSEGVYFLEIHSSETVAVRRVVKL